MAEYRRCPFWHKKVRRYEPRYDATGKKIGEVAIEDVIHPECMREECELFDPEKKRCSILVITEILKGLSEDIKNKLDNVIYEKAEMLSVVFSTNFQHLQDMIAEYSKKTTELMEKMSKEKEM